MNKLCIFYEHVKEAQKQTGLSLEEIAHIAALHGISGVELDYQDLTPELAERLAKVGLPIVDVYRFFDWGRNPQATDWQTTVDLLVDCEIERLMVVPGFVDTMRDGEPIPMEKLQMLRDAARERMLPNVQKLCAYAKQKGICVAMEDFDDISAPFATARELLYFADNVPELGIAFDTGNFYYSGEDVLDAFMLLKNRITYVHCKDRSFYEKRLEPLIWTKRNCTPDREEPKDTLGKRPMFSTAVGAGIIPIQCVVELLLDQGYDGYFAIEHFGSRRQLEDMTESADYLMQLIKSHTCSCKEEVKKIHVTIWNEYIHEREIPQIGAIYPEGIHTAIANLLQEQAADDFEIRMATLDMPEHGLTQEVLAWTDVLIWWGHCAHDQVSDVIADRVVKAIGRGMGLIALHSAHFSKIMQRALGTSMTLGWKDDDSEILYVTSPEHPIAAGIPERIELPQEEMYCEFFDIPKPDDVIFTGWFQGGGVFRSGVTFTRGAGKIFYFQPGHEAYPIYHMPVIGQILKNAVYYLAGSSKSTENIVDKQERPLRENRCLG